MKVCSACKVPQIVSRDQIWHDDGTITISGDLNFRMVIFEVDLLNDIADRLERIVGPTIPEMLIEGSRRYARHYTNSLLKGPLRFVVRHTTTGAKLAYSKLLDTSAALGFGKVVMEGYEHGKRVMGKVYHPYNLPMFVGIVRGSFEAIENVPSVPVVKDEGNYAQVEIRRGEGELADETHVRFREPIRIPAENDHKRCPKCKLPQKVSALHWISERGTIMDTRTDTRVVMTGLRDLASVFQSLESTVGDIVPLSVREANQSYGALQVARGWIRSYDDLVDDMAMKGMAGIRVTEEPGGGKRFEVRNPYNKDYLVGRCMGVFEGLEGKIHEPDIVDEPGLVELVLRP